MTIAHPNGKLIIDTGSPISFGDIDQIEICGHTHKLKSNRLLSEIKKHSEGEFVGLLGMDILRQYNILIKPDRQRSGFRIVFDDRIVNCDDIEKSIDFSMQDITELTVLDVSFGKEEAEEEEDLRQKKSGRMEVDFIMGIPVVELEINGAPRKFFVDTGASVSYIKEELVAGKESLGEKEDFYPIIGTFKTESYAIKASLGGMEFNSEMCVLPETLNALLANGIDGILGADDMANFTLFMGFRSDVFWVKRDKILH